MAMVYGWNSIAQTPSDHYEIGNPHLLDGLDSIIPLQAEFSWLCEWFLTS
jgi:hypothetical protein